MKYMGSKRWMLRNGLGQLIRDEAQHANRFVDLFTGSGAVAHFAATLDHPIEVQAFDLQQFCVALADAVITRVQSIEPDSVLQAWHNRAVGFLKQHRQIASASRNLPTRRAFTRSWVERARIECQDLVRFPITAAYGGHYFSKTQSLWIDAFRNTVPETTSTRRACLGALIQAASQCAASPGHTAQPFQPTQAAKPFIYEAWTRDVVTEICTAFWQRAPMHASICGKATVGDANVMTKEIHTGDLVFLDPPYSAVQYSRFYHVLESIANGVPIQVCGAGRYPPDTARPRSKYSVKSESGAAIEDLLERIAGRGASALLTFPDHDCSNGLSGNAVAAIARKYFTVRAKQVENRFSTLGGTKSGDVLGNGRLPRQYASETIFVLKPL